MRKGVFIEQRPEVSLGKQFFQLRLIFLGPQFLDGILHCIFVLLAVEAFVPVPQMDVDLGEKVEGGKQALGHHEVAAAHPSLGIPVWQLPSNSNECRAVIHDKLYAPVDFVLQTIFRCGEWKHFEALIAYDFTALLQRAV